jgi:hypothetical protein
MAPGRAGLVVVAGVGGGVGASTFAALLARERARAGRAVLVDLAGTGGLDVLLGVEQRAGVRWADLVGDASADVGLDDLGDALEDLAGALPRWRGVEVLSCGRDGGLPPAGAVAPLLGALADAGASVVVDARPGTRVWGGTTGLVAGLDGAWDGGGHGPARSPGRGGPGTAALVLVSGQDTLGVAALLAARAQSGAAAAGVVLRRRRRSRVAPVEAAHVADLPLLGVLPHDRRLGDAVERGLGPVAGWRLRHAVAAVARRLGETP